MSTILFPYYRKLRKYAPACLLFHDGVVNEINQYQEGRFVFGSTVVFGSE